MALTDDVPLRTDFFAEQRRHRRASRRLAHAAAAAVALMGIPVSLVIAPLLYGVVLIVLDVANLLHPLPSVTGPLAAAAHAFSNGELSSPMAMTLAGAAVIAPGMAAIVVLWLGVRALPDGDGCESHLRALAARAPRPGDLEERQLQNVVEEMSVAAGLPPPRIRLIDSPAANAAVFGSSGAGATIVVSRGLLDGFSREDTQALAGHLVASISNGDLEIASVLGSTLQTFGLLITLLDAPSGPASAGRFRRVVRIALRRGLDDADAGAIGDMLAARLLLDDGPEPVRIESKYERLRAPLIVASQAVKWTLFVFTTALVGPMLALLWRSRRYLADATAVQLTRNPGALWHALAELIQKGGMPEASAASSYLFVVGPETVGWQRPGAPPPPRVDDKMGTNSLLTFHPDIGRRLRRLVAQGAAAPPPEPRAVVTPLRRLLTGAGTVLVWGLFGIGMAAAAAGMVLVVGVSVLMDVLVLGLIHAFFSLFAA
ncbi:MAG: M48 family metalloprotease [Acidobacteriota bacterium]